jgi:hypothetical protein
MPTICTNLTNVPMQWYAASIDLRDAANRFEQAARLFDAGRPKEAEDAARRALEAAERGVDQIPGWM